jgi:hypothetical protein
MEPGVHVAGPSVTSASLGERRHLHRGHLSSRAGLCSRDRWQRSPRPGLYRRPRRGRSEASEARGDPRLGLPPRHSRDSRAGSSPCSLSGRSHLGHAPYRREAPDALTSAHVGDFVVDTSDVVVADDDGAIFLPAKKVGEIATAARTSREREHQQAKLLAAGNPLFQHLRLAEYLSKHTTDPSYTLRLHLQGDRPGNRDLTGERGQGS